MRCPKCEGEDCVRVHINLRDSDSIDFYSCRLCEAMWWEHFGDTISLEEALELTARKDPR